MRDFVRCAISTIRKFKQFLFYCMVGVTSTLVDLVALYLLVEYAGLPVIPATILSFLLAVVNGFVWNRIFTFKIASKNYRKQFVKFLIVSVVGLLLTVSLMYVFVYLILIWYLLAKAMTSVIVLMWNFLGNKYWTFKMSERNLHVPDKFEYDFSIIIPAYNEENRIGGTLLIIKDFIKKNSHFSYEIIVVDDGSTDLTNGVARDVDMGKVSLRVLSYAENMGKGYAIKTGVMKTKGKFVLFTDADNSTPIEELKKMVPYIESGFDVVVGSRYLKGSDVRIRQSKARIFIGRVGNLLIRAFLISGIKDTQCGFKLFTHKAAKEIFAKQKVKRFGFDMEALVVARSLGYKIKEVPVSWFNSVESRVRPIKDALRTLKDLVYIKLNLWSGRYSSED